MERKEAIESYPWSGEEKIFDCRRKVDNANLHHGRCKMDDDYRLDIMIRKGVEIKKNTYDMMMNFQHVTCIPLLSFYNEGNMGRLTIPSRVKSSFDKWIGDEGQPLLLDGQGNMSLLFKTMICDFCDLVEKLGHRRILIKNLNLKNLYVAAETTPRILVLVTEAEQLSRALSKMEQWKPVKDVIECIFKKCKVELNHEATRFLGFIVTEKFTAKSLRKYPHDWDIQTKRDYLLALAAKQGVIRSTIRHAGIAWPLVDGKLPEVLDQIIIVHQSNLRNRSPYNTNVPLDYIRLIRNTYKHFSKFPSYIKRAFGNHQDGFINCIEQWTPDIWENIYDMIGWP